MTVRGFPASTGGWFAVVGRSSFLVVDSVIDVSMLDEAWASVDHEDMFQRVLDLLTRGGLAQTPSFVLADLASGVRIVARGPGKATVVATDGELDIDGAGVSTWVERHFPDARAVTVSIPGAVRAIERSLPLETGVALVAALEVSVSTGKDAAQPAPSTTATPLREPVAAPLTAAPPPTAPAVASTQNAAQQAPRIPALATPSSAAIEADVVDIGVTMTVSPMIESVAPPEASESAADGYDYLFGDTIYRSVADAAVQEAPTDQAYDASAATVGDHDGHTVLTSDISKLRGSRRARPGRSEPVETTPAPTVMLTLSSTGTREPLKQPVVIGRNPSVGKVEVGEIPRLITLANDQDISRNHARISLEGGTVVVTDLHSRNGTIVVLPGKEPQKLRAGEPTAVIIGTVVDLGGGVTITIEGE